MQKQDIPGILNMKALRLEHTMYWIEQQRVLWLSVLSKNVRGASLVAQWLRVCLPVQGTRVRALVWENPA